MFIIVKFELLHPQTYDAVVNKKLSQYKYGFYMDKMRRVADRFCCRRPRCCSRPSENLSQKVDFASLNSPPKKTIAFCFFSSRHGTRRGLAR